MTAPAPDRQTAIFQAHRAVLQDIAYRMLGSVSEAEDAVQETWVRWHRHGGDGIDRPRAWLVTTLSRLCIDALKSARRQREIYVGPWLPEPVETDAGGIDSERLAVSVRTAFLLVLERLTPVERAAYLLHDIFDMGYDEVAATLGRSETACRKTVSRARTRVQAAKPRFEMAPPDQQRLAEQFLQSILTGELEPLKRMLADDAQLWADGGGRVLAARNVIRGRDAVARFLVGVAGKAPPTISTEYGRVNGGPGLLVWDGADLVAAFSVELATDGTISHVFTVRNPDKLAHLIKARHPVTPGVTTDQ